MEASQTIDIQKNSLLSPVTLSSSCDQSRVSSVSPPRIIAVINKSGDGAVRSSLDQRFPQNTRRTRNMYHRRNYRSRSHSLDKSPPNRYRSRSRSSSPPKSYQSRSRGKVIRNRRSRSRSRSYRNQSSRSHSYRKMRKSRWSRSRSRSESASSHRKHSRGRCRSRSSSLKACHHGDSSDTRRIWETFNAELDALERMREEDERLYDKNPEKHPDYKLEWKKFYKRRVQEIVDCGYDPKLYNFESEWAYFWKCRMSTLINFDFERKKRTLRRRLNLPYTAEIDTNLKDFLSTKRIMSSPRLISTLRTVTAVEEQLGSLGPRVNCLLSEAISLHEISGKDPDCLLSNPETLVLLETVKEKLFGKIQSNIVRKGLEGAVKEALNSIDVLLQCYAPPMTAFIQNQQCASNEEVNLPQNSGVVVPVNVPGVGVMDRLAVAQQLADELVKQGKTNVTEAELQVLVNEVMGMIGGRAAQEKERGLTSLKETPHLQEPGLIPVAPSETSIPDPPSLNRNSSPLPKISDALDTLMSVLQSTMKKNQEPNTKSSDPFAHEWSSDDSDEPIINKNSPASSLVLKRPANDSEKQDKVDLEEDFGSISEPIKRMPSSERPGISASFAKKETPELYSYVKKSPSREIFKSEEKKVSAEKGGNERERFIFKTSLSPFSSRKETSNPLPNSEEIEEDEDLKVIGAWDSDSDIDLDSFGISNGPAYDKINAKKLSPDKYEKNMSLLNKSKRVLQNTCALQPTSVGADINLDAAIDNLMGELRNKNSKMDMVSSKPQSIAKPRNTNTLPRNIGQPILAQTEHMPANEVVMTQNYNVPYYYPQPYSAVQQVYYSNSYEPGRNQIGGPPYYNYNQGGNTAAYYGNYGNSVYSPANVQLPEYYGSQQTNMPSNPNIGTNYGVY
ncbi:uncharacterized protein [Hetaerina americana]|uniref:uncharacterized protein n=1 Tax=Hetaerina americana TaxID=62018 RepID=UPI003A7F3333